MFRIVGWIAVLPFAASIAFGAMAQTVCDDNRKIVGGVDTKIEEHRWQVALTVPWPDHTELCGGSLI